MASKTNPNRAPDANDPPTMLDITADACPMTFVRTRLALDRLRSGDLLLVRLRGEEPRQSVPTNAIGLGHTVVWIKDYPDGVTEMLLRHA